MGEKPKHTTARKPDPLQIIQQSLSSALFFYLDQGYRNKTEDVMTAFSFSSFCILTPSPSSNLPPP
jgi:hypothetical protein